MKKDFSTSWISSKKPNKQRKYRFNAPLHIKGTFLNVHLSKDLRQKYNLRSIRVRVGDKVKILRGQFKKQEAKVEEVNVKKTEIFLSKIEHTKRDGTKARHPVDPSNLMIIELNTDDKKRFATVKKPEAKKSELKKSDDSKHSEKAVNMKTTEKTEKSERSEKMEKTNAVKSVASKKPKLSEGPNKDGNLQ